MFGYIKRVARNHFLSVMKEEIENYILSLQGMTDEELGWLIVHATHSRNKIYESEDVDLLDPIVAVSQDRRLIIKINKLVRRNQEEKLLSDAAALMVWLHTLRAVSEPELRIFGKKMWGELKRGFPFVEKAFNEIQNLSSKNIDVSNWDSIPNGLGSESKGSAQRAASLFRIAGEPSAKQLTPKDPLKPTKKTPFFIELFDTIVRLIKLTLITLLVLAGLIVLLVLFAK